MELITNCDNQKCVSKKTSFKESELKRCEGNSYFNKYQKKRCKKYICQECIDSEDRHLKDNIYCKECIRESEKKAVEWTKLLKEKKLHEQEIRCLYEKLEKIKTEVNELYNLDIGVDWKYEAYLYQWRKKEILSSLLIPIPS